MCLQSPISTSDMPRIRTAQSTTTTATPVTAQTRHCPHRTEYDIPRAVAPRPLADATAVMRNAGCDNLRPLLAFCPQFMGQQAIAATRQHVVGVVTHVDPPSYPALPRAAPRRRCTAATTRGRLRAAASGSDQAWPTPRVAPTPRQYSPRVSHWSRLAGPSLVPGRVALRTSSRPSSPQKRRRGRQSYSTTAGRPQCRPSLAVDWNKLCSVSSGLGARRGDRSGAALASARAEYCGILPTPIGSFRAFLRLRPASSTTSLPCHRLSEHSVRRRTASWDVFASLRCRHRGTALALEDPTSHKLVALARRGFAAADARRRRGVPPWSAAFPADAASHCLRAALSATTPRLLWY
jgi:hypothetical protein